MGIHPKQSGSLHTANVLPVPSASLGHALEEREMGLRMAHNYPRGVECVRWKLRGVVSYTVYYTPPEMIDAEARVVGTIRHVADCIYTIAHFDHPPLKSKTQAVWWLYSAAISGDQGGR